MGEPTDTNDHAKKPTAAAAADVVVDVDEDDDDDDEASIDQEQLDEYKEMIEQLGSHADKVTINSLSMVADDHSDSKASARALYDIIRERLLTTRRENMLPLVYLLDSILKNVKGCYITLMEDDAEQWMPTIYKQLPETDRPKLQRVWKFWNEPYHIFSSQEKWKAIGRCFSMTPQQLQSSGGSSGGGGPTSVAGISRMKDGKLIVSSTLRKEMQSILDELQSDITDELEKVSLERLADINPDLLANIKRTAEETINSSGGTASSTTASLKKQQARGGGGKGSVTSTTAGGKQLPPFFTETRSDDVLHRSKAWGEVKWEFLEQTHKGITKLQHQVRDICTASTTAAATTETEQSSYRFTQQEALDMTQYLAAASATASLITNALERIKNQEDRKDNKENVSFPGMDPNLRVRGSILHRGYSIDVKDFTNDGIKKKNDAVISMLYDVGLPFVSSADGRRFATQLELSKHLDHLFKKNQLEKSMARTEERGWYIEELVWLGDVKEGQAEAGTSTTGAGGANDATTSETADNGEDPFDMDSAANTTVPADESRDRCVICGINFKMFFDNDDGIYKYSNCREIEVLNDDASEVESEQQLVHVTCWRGLGSPKLLTSDQALQETLRHY